MKGWHKVILIFLSIILLLIIYWSIPFSVFKNSFDKEIKERVSSLPKSDQVVSQDEIEKLPKAFKKHLETIGFVGSPKFQALNIKFDQADFLFNTEKNTRIKMDYDLWLFCDKPFRTAFIESRIFGIPFDGIDYMKEDKTGGMKGFLARAFQIFDQNNEQMYKAGLISWLAEGAVLNPSILLSDYVSLEEVDSNHVKARVTFDGVSGQGVFTFDENGLLQDFYSLERQEEEYKGDITKLGWKAIYKDFVEGEYYKIPQVIKSSKIYPEGEVVYFDSDSYTIKFY